MHPRNKTRYKTLDKVASDPRVVEVWDEGEDGLWVELAEGFNHEGTSGLHEYTCKDLIEALGRIEVGHSC
jgi:hypothetical protein